MAEAAIPLHGPMTASLRRLAEEFGLSRDTVARRVKDAGVRPAAHLRSHPVYRLRDVAPLLVDRAMYDAAGNVDPDRLPPDKRRAWFQSERERIDVEMRAGLLVPALEHERDVARVLGAVVQLLETLPDVLERDESLSPPQVHRLQQILDAKRQELYDRLVEPPQGAHA